MYHLKKESEYGKKFYLYINRNIVSLKVSGKTIVLDTFLIIYYNVKRNTKNRYSFLL